MSRSRIILRNIASNWTGFAVQAAIHFFLTPFILEQLGDTRYGVWVLTITITGYYGLLAFGLTGGVTQYVTRYLAVRDFDKLNEAASTAFAILSGLGTLVLASSVALAAFAPRLFNIPDENLDEVFWCILIVGIAVAAQFTLFLFSAVLVATQRYDLTNFVGISVNLLSAALTFLLLRQGYGLVGLCIANTASEIIGYLLRRKMAYRVLPELAISRRRLSLPALRSLFSYGTWSFVIAIAQSIFSQIDALVIGAFMPMAAVSRYALAASVCTQMQSVLRPIDRVFFPTFTDLHARGDIAGMRSLYLRASRLYLVVVAVVATIAAFWANDFYRLWIGARFVETDAYPSVPFIYHLLTIAIVGQLLPAMGGQVLVSSLNVRALAVLAITEAITNALLSILFVQFWGLAGVALGTIVSVFAIRTFGIPLLARPIVGIGLPGYLSSVVVRPAVVALCLYPLIAAARHVVEPQNFAMLILLGLVSLAAAAPLALIIGLTRNERETHVYPLVRRLAGLSQSSATGHRDA